MNYLLVVILWTAYCTLHSFLISVRFTDLMTRLLKNYYAFYRLFYVVISFILLVPLIRFTGEFESPVIMTYDAPLYVAKTESERDSAFQQVATRMSRRTE